MASTGDVCCSKKPSGPSGCIKNEDGTCTFTTQCTLKLPEGEFICECICTCHRSSTGDCSKCVCKCECTPEKAQRIEEADGTVKYRCECTCTC